MGVLFFDDSRVDTRSACLGQTGSETLRLHLTSCNVRETFLSGHNGMVTGSIHLVYRDRGRSVVTAGPWFITWVWASAHTRKRTLEMESII